MNYNSTTYNLANFLEKIGRRAGDFVNYYRNLDTSCDPESMIYYHACYLVYVIKTVNPEDFKNYGFLESFNADDLVYISSTLNSTVWQNPTTQTAYVVFYDRDDKSTRFYQSLQTEKSIVSFNLNRKDAYLEKHQSHFRWIADNRIEYKNVIDSLIDNHHPFDVKKQILMPVYGQKTQSREQQENFMSFKGYLNLIWGSEDEYHGWSKARFFDVGGVVNGEPEFIWSEYITIDALFEDSDFLLTPIMLKMFSMAIDSKTNWTGWIKDHVIAVINRNNHEVRIPINGYQNPNEWWNDTYLICVSAGHFTINFVVEADYEGDAIDEFVDGFYGHLIIDEEANEKMQFEYEGIDDFNGDDEYTNRSRGGNESKILVEDFTVYKCEIVIE